MQKYVDLLDLIESFPTSVYLQKSISIHTLLIRTDHPPKGHEYRSVDPVAVPVAQHFTVVGLGLEDHDREARPAKGRFLARCDRIELLGYIVEFLFPMFILTPT